MVNITTPVRDTIMQFNRVVRAFSKRIGFAGTRRFAWDREFASGHWDNLEDTKDDVVYRYLEKYLRPGDLLDLGCGSGNTGSELSRETCQSYTGVDVSAVAIEKAKLRSRLNQRTLNEYLCCDIETFLPRRSYDVILFRESIYYVPILKLKALLQRYSQYLKSNGVFVVRICDQRKHGGVINLISRNFQVLESAPVNAGMILVFSQEHPVEGLPE
jgi:2-polyprenyl-3-methyl-5-hydroxy-6-metoxy-1,4-benzoquinol methylase